MRCLFTGYSRRSSLLALLCSPHRRSFCIYIAAAPAEDDRRHWRCNSPACLNGRFARRCNGLLLGRGRG